MLADEDRNAVVIRMRRKHPFLLGILLLVSVGVALTLFVSGLSSFSGYKSFAMKDKVGVVTVKGVITDSRAVVELLKKYEEDSAVRAVVVRIDSPGGGVAPSQEIYDAVTSFKKKKKIVASMGSVAASGGYYIACAADRIVANPGTFTGSIGALMHFSNLEELMKKIGLKSSVVKSGRFKDIGSPAREMTSEERGLLQGVIDDIYNQFLEAVSVTRKIPKDKLVAIADGRIMTGRQALQHGLVDELGNMDRAVELAAMMSGIKGKPEVIYPKEKGLTIWKFIADEMMSAIMGRLNEENMSYRNTARMEGYYPEPYGLRSEECR
jgi:protease-4